MEWWEILWLYGNWWKKQYIFAIRLGDRVVEGFENLWETDEKKQYISVTRLRDSVLRDFVSLWITDERTTIYIVLKKYQLWHQITLIITRNKMTKV